MVRREKGAVTVLATDPALCVCFFKRKQYDSKRREIAGGQWDKHASKIAVRLLSKSRPRDPDGLERTHIPPQNSCLAASLVRLPLSACFGSPSPLCCCGSLSSLLLLLDDDEASTCTDAKEEDEEASFILPACRLARIQLTTRRQFVLRRLLSPSTTLNCG